MNRGESVVKAPGHHPVTATILISQKGALRPCWDSSSATMPLLAHNSPCFLRPPQWPEYQRVMHSHDDMPCV